MLAELEQQGFIKKCEAAPKPRQPEQLLEKAVEAVLEGVESGKCAPRLYYRRRLLDVK